MAFVFLSDLMGRVQRLRWWAVAVAVLPLVLLLSIPLGSWMVVSRDVSQPDAILVLGSHEHERLPEAVRQATRHPTARVLLTVPVIPTQHNCQDCAQRVAQLARQGVAPHRIHVVTPPVRNTWDELLAASSWAARHEVARILIVTSPYHTRRVSYLAPWAGPQVAWGIAAAPVADGLAWPWWSRRYDRRYVVYECAALVANLWRLGGRERGDLAAP